MNDLGISYVQVPNMEHAASIAIQRVESSQDQKVLHAIFHFELEKESLRHAIVDETERAQLWRQPEIPTKLVINHGSFLKDGLQHIIRELKSKRSSRRALYSLINQNDINDKEDEPIPSFMIFQCSIINGTLYCAAYFRALEMHNFFRINLEEIRLNLVDILEEIGSVENIRLAIFVFDAYSKPDQTPLEKCAFDLVDRMELPYIIEDKGALIELLKEKAKCSSYINVVPFNNLKWAFGSTLIQERLRHYGYSIDLVQRHLDLVISSYNTLGTLRRSYSSDQKDVNQQQIEYAKEVDKLINAINVDGVK